MRWLARFLFLAFCLCLISCSAQSFLFLHNDTSSPFDYKIQVKFKRDKAKQSAQGTIERNDVVSVLSYYSDEAEQVEIEITQKGNSRSELFKGHDLPDSLNYASSNGPHSYVRVTDQDISIGEGSGNVGADFQHKYWMLFPCFGIVLLFGIVGVVLHYKQRAKQNRQASSPL